MTPSLRETKALRGASAPQAALVICIAGSGLAAFFPTYFRSVRLSQSSEAVEMLADMHRKTSVYFASEHEGQTHCLPTAAGPTPRVPHTEASVIDFAGDAESGHATWSALGVLPTEPLRFSYVFDPVSVGCRLQASDRSYLVSFRAEGDFDGDGEHSLFERRAGVDPRDHSLIPVGILYVQRRTE